MTDAKNSRPGRRARALAPVLALLLTALLHLLVIDWGNTYFHERPAQDAATPISVSLRALPLPTQAVSLPLASTAKPLKKPKPAPVSIPAVTGDSPAQLTTNDDSTAAGLSNSIPAIESEAATPSPPVATDAPPAELSGTHYVIDAPPSANLEYQVNAFSNQLEWHGTSTLSWQLEGEHYRVEGEVYTRFFAKVSFLTFVSTGDIDAFGVAPELYTEKKRNRPSTNTHFNRDRNIISFSASENSYPRHGGEQDRASLIWQLAAIGRGDSTQFADGKVIDLFVAGVRDGELWRMQVAGLEDLSLPSGHVQAWHVLRQPRPGSYEQRLDIWLAPAAQWYPVRLRFTETNGDYLEMTVSNLKTL